MRKDDFNAQQLLLVEGSTDKFFIGSFKDKKGIKIKPVIECLEENTGGIEFILKRLLSALKDESLTSIGVVVDADSNIEAAFSLISNALKQIKKIEIGQLKESGLIIQLTESQKFGLWIWPNNSAKGDLESLLHSIVPKNDVVFHYSQTIVSQLIEKKINPFKEKDQRKAEIYTWLAWQEEPGQPFGKAVKFSYFNLETETCNNFKSWLQRLYSNEND